MLYRARWAVGGLLVVVLVTFFIWRATDVDPACEYTFIAEC